MATTSMNTTAWFDELALFLGSASVQSARCYARCPRPDEGRAWRLEGTVRGPFSTRARTLPATTTWSDTGYGPTLMATALIPDPCYWTPDNPALYDVQLRVLDGSREIGGIRRMFGLRRLGARDRSFRFESHRWVLRGISRFLIHSPFPASAHPVPMNDERMRNAWEAAPWRDQQAALVASRLTDDECERAQRDGRVLVAWVRLDQAGWQNELRRLSRSAAVAFAILAGQPTADDAPASDMVESPRVLAPNLCLLQAFSSHQSVRPSDWAHGVVVEPEDDPVAFARRTQSCGLPIVAYRPFVPSSDPRSDPRLEWSNLASATNTANSSNGSREVNLTNATNTANDLVTTWVSQAFNAARAAVDVLQRDLAPAGDYAGYLV